MDHLPEKAGQWIIELKELFLGLSILLGHVFAWLAWLLNNDTFIGAVAGLGALATALGAVFHAIHLYKRIGKD